MIRGGATKQPRIDDKPGRLQRAGMHVARVRRAELLHAATVAGADPRLAPPERLRRMSALAREAFGAERAWIAFAQRSGGGWTCACLSEDSDLRFPGAMLCGEPTALDALAPAIERMTRASGPLRFGAPFAELDGAARGFLARFHVEVTVETAIPAQRRSGVWVVGLDFCRPHPHWSRHDAAALAELARVAATLAEAAELFQLVEQAKRELEIVFDTQPDGVAMVDAEGYVVRCNREYARIRGAGGPAEARGMAAACAPVPRCGVEGCALQVARRAGAARSVVREEGADGPRWRECSVQAVAGAAGLYLHVVRDVTEQRLLSERAAQQARLESLGTLAGGVAHEFNNILMGMRPAVERLRRQVRCDARTLGQLDASLERAGQLSRRMLALSRQRTSFEARSAIGEALAEVVEVLASTLPRNIRILADVAPDLGLVALDPAAVHSVLLNLATNARDAMPGGGELYVEARRSTVGRVPRVVVTVRDTGHGIRAEDLPRVFDPFFSTKGSEGTGLGLAVVHRLVSEAGGSVVAESATDAGGATFTITLPVVGLEGPCQAMVEATVAADLDGLHVLLVDDEPMIREGVSYLLREAGAAVVCCESAEEALAEFADSPDRFGAVVVDYGLPGLDGCALLGQLLDIRPRLIAVLVSGYTETQRFSALRLQGVRFFQKPFRVTELITHLAERA